MQITLRQLVDGWESLQKLSGIGLNSGISPVNAFLLSKLLGSCQPEVERFETVRRDLFVSLGEEVDGEYKIKPENVEEFFQKITPLLNQDIELPGNPIPVSDLGQGLPLTVGDLGRISWLFTE